MGILYLYVQKYKSYDHVNINILLGEIEKKRLNKILTKDWRLFLTFVVFLYYNSI